MKGQKVTEKEINEMVEALISSNTSRSSIRVLSEEEKKFITTDAFGYLIHLNEIGSINETLLEKVLSISLQMSIFLKKVINKKMMDEVVNYIIFSESANISLRDILDLIISQENDIGFNEEIN